MNHKRFCGYCRTLKEITDFHFKTKDGTERQYYCKECHKQSQRERYVRNPENIRKHNLRRMGLSVEEYEQMSSQQGDKCAACGSVETSIDGKTKKVRRLAIDHDHNCCPKKRACKDCIRGLLCQSCNKALGLLNDDLSRVLMLADYIQKNPRFWA